MALSGSITGSYRGWTVRSEWRATQSISGNYSDITVTHYLDMSSGYSLNIGSRSNTCTVDGQTASFSSGAINKTGGTTTLGTTSYRVYHNSDGNKSCSLSTVFNIKATLSGVYVASITASGTISLNKIPRYATSNQTLTAKTETTATMKWSSDSTVDYIWYSINNGSSWTGVNVTDGKSGSYTISGLEAGTTYKIKTRVRRKDSQLTTDSSALSVTTYDYPYANSMPNFTIGEKLTLGIYNPLGREVTVNILGADNSQISNDTTTGTSITGYAGDVVVNRLYASIPNAKSGTYKVKVTYGEEVSTKTGGTYTVNPADCSPTIGSGSYRDANTTTTAITGNNQQIIRNHSTVNYTAGGLAAQKSATIESCSVAVNGNAYNLTLNAAKTTATGGGATIDSSYDVTATFTVVDSRGLTATKEITVTILDWTLPTAITTLQRHNNFYSETDITVDADYAYLDGKNDITIVCRYKKITDSTYSAGVSLSDNVTQVITLDNNYAWDVQVVVSDKLGSTTYNYSISRGMPIIYFDRLLSSLGVNCFPVDEKSLEVNGFNIQKSVMTRSLSAQITNLVESTYTIIPLDLSNSTGSKLTATNDGGIKIGAGVSKVLVSGKMAVENVVTGGNRHLRIMKNSYTNANTLGWAKATIEVSDSEDVIIPTVLADVQENDVIYLWYHTPDSADKITGNSYGARTSLTVEVVA